MVVSKFYTHISHFFHIIITASCVDGDIKIGVFNFTDFYIRINEFEDYYFIKDEIARGRVEVCVGGRFGSVCGTNWDDNDASVTCNQLGFSPFGSLMNKFAKYIGITSTMKIGAIGLSSGLFGDEIESVVLHDVDCSGDEIELLSCSLSYTGSCSGHSAAVICQGKQHASKMH